MELNYNLDTINIPDYIICWLHEQVIIQPRFLQLKHRIIFTIDLIFKLKLYKYFFNSMKYSFYIKVKKNPIINSAYIYNWSRHLTRHKCFVSTLLSTLLNLTLFWSVIPEYYIAVLSTNPYHEKFQVFTSFFYRSTWKSFSARCFPGFFVSDCCGVQSSNI